MNDVVIWQPGVSLSDIERMVIVKAFAYYRGNKSLTASSLGIAVRTLDTKLQQYEETKINKTKQPTKKDLLEEAHAKTGRTGPFGADQRFAKPTEYTSAGDGNGKTGPGGRMSDEQLDYLRARKIRLQEEAASAKAALEASAQAEAGPRLEPAAKGTEEQSVSVPERKKVQALPPKPSTKNSRSEAGATLQNSHEGQD